MSPESAPGAGPPDRSRAIALTVAAAYFMESLVATIITAALPALAASYGTSPLAMTAGITVYLIAMAVFIPAAGWCAERLGARRVFAAAVICFTLASLACGLAASLMAFVAGAGGPRVLTYPLLVFAGMTRSMNFTTIATLAFADVPDEQRAGANSLATLLQLLGMSLGVSFAAVALGLSQTLRDAGGGLALVDFQRAWFAIGILMAAATLAAWFLPREVGRNIAAPA